MVGWLERRILVGRSQYRTSFIHSASSPTLSHTPLRSAPSAISTNCIDCEYIMQHTYFREYSERACHPISLLMRIEQRTKNTHNKQSMRKIAWNNTVSAFHNISGRRKPKTTFQFVSPSERHPGRSGGASFTLSEGGRLNVCVTSTVTTSWIYVRRIHYTAIASMPASILCHTDV